MLSRAVVMRFKATQKWPTGFSSKCNSPHQQPELFKINETVKRKTKSFSPALSRLAGLNELVSLRKSVSKLTSFPAKFSLSW